MTDQPYTPTTEQVRFAATFPNENFSLKGSDFDRWLATIESAAEQRGAIKALRNAAESDDLIDHMLTNLPMNQPIAVRETSKYLHNRADRLEGDE